MKRPFLDPEFRPADVSAQLVYGGTRLDRWSEDRSEDCLDQALSDPTCLIMGFAKGRVVLAFDDPDQPRGLFSTDDIDRFQPKYERAVLLGFDQGAPRLAVPLGIDPNEDDFSLPEPYKAIDYRSIAVQGLLDAPVFGILAHGGAMLAWHSTNRFCARCGGATDSREGGIKRVCQGCEKEHFPRTDPVVIMLATRGDKCLLGRSPHFPPGMYSALAGFVEPGETLEGAVRRETFEESGIRIGTVTYHASQPWPFPHSLMIGCYGEALDDQIDRDSAELDDCRWFTRAELIAILNGDGPRNAEGEPLFFTPPKMAIARQLITDWVAANE